MSVATLRDTLLAALATLPGARSFHIHTLVAAPHKHADLFPYAHPRPKVYLQDVFVLLSEQSTDAPDAPRVLATAVELSVYTIPATSCGVVYVSKVDTTGQGTRPSPTATLVKALLAYYVDPATRPLHVDTLWLQLFARAQGQYLFPNSADYAEKRPLTDVKLCAWWKRIIGEVADEVSARMKSSAAKMRLFYILPGFNELEAMANLHMQSATPAHTGGVHAQWTYGHHYAQSDIRLPCPPPKGAHSLGHYIPWFDDCPKSRFIDEIAHTTEGDVIKSPEAKRPRNSLSRTMSRGTVDLAKDGEKEKDGGEKEREKEEKPRHHEGELGKVTPDEFWERMSFRQECIAGAVTGFFSLGITSTSSTSAKPISTSSEAHKAAPPPLAPQPGQVAPKLVKRVISSLMNGYDFSTRESAVRATEMLEGVIRGLCDNVVDSAGAGARAKADADADVSARAPLLFPSRAQTQTNDQRDTITPERDLPSGHASLEVPRTPTRRSSKTLPEVSPNPFPEPVASAETYSAHIYGSIAVDNPLLPPKSNSAGAGAQNAQGSASGGGGAARPVTVLTVRKKRKVAS